MNFDKADTRAGQDHLKFEPYKIGFLLEIRMFRPIQD